MVDIGDVGVKGRGLRSVEEAEAVDAAMELESLRYGAIWIGADPAGLEERVSLLLGATRKIVVATSIATIWEHPAAETAAMCARLDHAFPGRFLLGLGVSHASLGAQRGFDYHNPLTTMRDYLDALDSAPRPVPPASRILAALAPKMLALAGSRSMGTHPLLTPPAHTAWARAEMGSGAVIAPTVMVVLERDETTARARLRNAIHLYLSLPNYRDNFLRSGFDAYDLENGGSDRLLDGVTAWGDLDRIGRFVGEHRAAGADHIVLDPVTDDPLPRDLWRRLSVLG